MKTKMKRRYFGTLVVNEGRTGEIRRYGTWVVTRFMDHYEARVGSAMSIRETTLVQILDKIDESGI